MCPNETVQVYASDVIEVIDALRSEITNAQTRLRSAFCECINPGSGYDDCHVHGGGNRELYNQFPTAPYQLRAAFTAARAEIAQLQEANEGLKKVAELATELVQNLMMDMQYDGTVLCSTSSGALEKLQNALNITWPETGESK